MFYNDKERHNVLDEWSNTYRQGTLNYKIGNNVRISLSRVINIERRNLSLQGSRPKTNIGWPRSLGSQTSLH